MGIVVFTPIEQAEPWGRVVLLKTTRGHFIHVMINKSGEIVPWSEQDEKWTDGKFSYSEVTHWAVITGDVS